jgi:hypothetical protein
VTNKVARSSVGDVVYRAILRLYPVRFREDFAADMALDFADASDEAWLAARWTGLVRVWVGSAADVSRSLAVQWLRTPLPFVSLISIVIALSTAAIAQTIVPKGPFFVDVQPRDRDLIVLILLTACVLLVIAATIIFTLWFLRPLLYRRTTRKT